MCSRGVELLLITSRAAELATPNGHQWSGESANIMRSGISKRSLGISGTARIGFPLMVHRVRVPERSGRRGRRKRSARAALRVKTPAARV